MLDYDLSNQSNNYSNKNKKIIILSIFIIFVFFLYALRLFSLQIIEGDKYRKQSVKISSKVKSIPAQRGWIYDRNANLPVVINSDSFAIDLTPGEIPDGYYDTVTSKLAAYLGISKNDVDAKVPLKNRRSFTSFEIKQMFLLIL